jgi:hypothetical protein
MGSEQGKAIKAFLRENLQRIERWPSSRKRWEQPPPRITTVEQLRALAASKGAQAVWVDYAWHKGTPGGWTVDVCPEDGGNVLYEAPTLQAVLDAAVADVRGW